GKGGLPGLVTGLHSTTDESGNPNILEWDAAKNAKGYNVRLDGNNQGDAAKKLSTSTNSKDMSELETNRAYYVDVAGTDKNGREGVYSEGITFKRKTNSNLTALSAPQNLLIDEATKILSWSTVTNASGYEVIINENHQGIQQEATYNLGELTNSGTYNIYVVAKGDGIKYDDSEWSSIQYEIADSNATKLATPQGLKLQTTGGTQKLVWDGVAYADYYTLFIDGSPRTLSGGKPEYVLSGFAEGTYQLQVQANSNSSDYRSSDKSAVLTYTVDGAPTDKPTLTTPSITLDQNGKKVTWNKIDNASGYAVNIDGNDKSASGSSTSYSLADLPGGSHQIKVKAKGDGGLNYNDSDWSNTVTYVSDNQVGGKLETPTHIVLWQREGVVAWDPVKNAVGYTININGELYGTDQFNVAYGLKFLPEGEYDIKIKADADIHSDFEDSDYSSSVHYVSDGLGSGGGETEKPQLPQLDVPKNIRFSGIIMYWDAVPEATSYLLEWRKDTNLTASTEPQGQAGQPQKSLDNLNNGLFYLRLKSVAGTSDIPSTEWSDSEWSDYIVYDKTNPDLIPYKPPYNLKVHEVSGINRFEWEAEKADQGFNLDIGGELIHTWQTYYSLDGLPSGKYSLKVKALPQDTSPTYVPSEWAVLEWDNTVPQLDTPQNVKSDTSKREISWDAVNSASQYVVSINGVEYIAHTNSFDLNVLNDIKTYTIKVRAQDKVSEHPLSQSNWSDSVSYAPGVVQVGKPVGYMDGKTLNWYLIPNATGYDVKVDGDVVATASAVEQEMDMSFLTEPRTYVVSVQAKGNGGQYLDSYWANDISYLLTNNPPLTGDTSPDAVVARFESLLPREEWDNVFRHRLGTRIWKDDSEAQSYYNDVLDRERRTDFYTYDNLVKALRTLAGKQLLIEDRSGKIYWGSSRITAIDKLTGRRVLLQQEAEGQIENDFDDQAPENIRKPKWSRLIDFGEFMLTSNANDMKRELVAMLANFSHETNGGFRGENGAIPDEYTYGLFWNEELSFINATSSYYQNEDPLYPAVPGHSYHGRGPIQITWNYNYGQFSNIVFQDKNTLLENPELVSEDGALGFMAGIWFWMMPQYPKASCHDIMLGNFNIKGQGEPLPNGVAENSEEANQFWYWGRMQQTMTMDQYFVPNATGKSTASHFAVTMVIINGGFEAGKGEGASASVDNRVGYYKFYANLFGVNIAGEKL
ncbi:MAG: chitinase, partial [Firmicutes bacterium]|nr:chitinase [Bacillota bacterium]